MVDDLRSVTEGVSSMLIPYAYCVVVLLVLERNFRRVWYLLLHAACVPLIALLSAL